MSEGGPVAQRPGLAIQGRHIMPGIEDRLAAAKVPLMLPDYLAFPGDDDPTGIHPQLYRTPHMMTVDTVAVAIKAHQAAGAYPGRPLCITVKWLRQGEQMSLLCFKNLPHGLISQVGMWARLRPLQAALPEVLVQLAKIPDFGAGDKKTTTHGAHLIFHLPLLPACRRCAGHRLKQIIRTQLAK